MVVGILGIGLIYKTFEETRRSANASDRSAMSARRAATYANDANRLARELQHRQLRPHLHLTQINRVKGRRIDTGGTISRYNEFKMILHNFGQTPAKDVTLRARCFAGGIWNTPFEASLENAVAVPFGTIPPGLDVTAGPYTT